MSGRSANTTKVFVGGLPTGTTLDELRDLFASYGTIADCNIVNRCGFVYLENKQLAFKAIDELNNFHFKGSRLCVEKGRIKPPSSIGGRNQRNGFNNNNNGGGGGGGGGGGPMRVGNRGDNFRGLPPSPYEQRRRGPPMSMSMSMPPMRRDNNYGYGYDSRPPQRNMTMMMMGPDRRTHMMDERNNRYSDSGYGDTRTYSDNRPPPYAIDDRRTLGERNNSNLMDRRPLMDTQASSMSGGGGGGGLGHSYTYDGRSQVDVYNRRDMPSKPMGGYNNMARDSSYDLAYPPLQHQQRGFVGGPRRDMPPPRRY